MIVNTNKNGSNTRTNIAQVFSLFSNDFESKQNDGRISIL